ncbi:MAG: hypothetical protein RIA69_03140 [Cyclobacteriaceae bacterium]
MKKVMLVFLSLVSFGVLAQETKKKTFNNAFNLGEYAPIYVSYYGNFITHPGAKIGFDWNLLTIEKKKEKKTRIKTVMHLFFATPSVTFFNLKETYNAFIVSGEAGWRRYGKRMFYEEVNVGLGYYTIFNQGDTWETKDDGTVSNIGTSATGYLTPSISFAFGQRFVLKNQIPMAVFTRLNTNLLLNYNAASIAEVSLELGMRMNVNWGIRTGAVKTKSK